MNSFVNLQILGFSLFKFDMGDRIHFCSRDKYGGEYYLTKTNIKMGESVNDITFPKNCITVNFKRGIIFVVLEIDSKKSRNK